jgi:hypothetical protein
MTAEEAWAKRDANERKCKEILSKKRATLVRITRNKIKNNLRACGVVARKHERERKKSVEALQKAGEFIPMDMLEAIPDSEKMTTDADIDLQLWETLISTHTDLTDLGLDPVIAADYKIDSEVQGDYDDIAQGTVFVNPVYRSLLVKTWKKPGPKIPSHVTGKIFGHLIPIEPK